MKIERNEINKMKKLLANVSYKPAAFGAHLIAFPISISEVKDFGGIEMVTAAEERGFGSERKPEPALILNSSEKVPVILGYCDFSFAKKFNIFEYCDIIGETAPGKLKGIDCFLISKEAVLFSVEI